MTSQAANEEGHSRFRRDVARDDIRKPYPCCKCSRSYTNKSTLNRHLREECGKLPHATFREPFSSDVFVREGRTGGNSSQTTSTYSNCYQCSDCERSCAWKRSFQLYMKLECGGEPQRSVYPKRDHNRVNYDAPFICYKCGKRYTWTDSLTRHLREGCGKLPRHKCTLCGRKFKLYFSPDYYKRFGRHSCSVCGKEYRWMQSLIRHEREECGKDPQYCCPICGAKIRHKWMLKKHLVNLHQWNAPDGKNT
ncbi:zinc finger protein 331-like [Hylaeus anthracinus]|uniref:zinc finger protein 331-like n=1 Tax=Hylaeus anthracinus TaxID=313031 RepID=UPI0023B885DE|nr:zinc finger protein 331-like [Hylaeus anthracinus]